MRTARTVLLLSLAAVAATVTPAAAAAPTWTGFICGFAALPDFSGPDPDRYYGEIDGGPVVVQPGDTSEPVVSATITCSLLVNEFDYTGTRVVSVSATGSGGVVYLPPTAITYRAAPGDVTPLCTTVSATTRNGTYTWNYDADDWTPGEQCSLALSAG